MLLHYMTPEETFSAVMKFLNSGNNFLVQSDVAQYATQHTLLALLKKHKVRLQLLYCHNYILLNWAYLD